MRPQLLARGLWALGLALAGACGSGGGNSSGAGNTGGGTPAACMWIGTGWSCSGGSSVPVSPGGGAGSGGASAVQPDGGSSDNSVGSNGGSGGGGTPGSTGGDGPSISFMEFSINTPSQPGQIVAGKDGNLWFNHQSTKPSAISKMTPAG